MIEHLRTTGKHVRRSPYQALAAVLIMSITFFVATVLATLAYISYSTLHYFETRPQIIAFLKNEANPDDISKLQHDLISDSRVRGVRYLSKEQALEIYKETTSENPLLSELVSPKVFPASLEFSVADLNFAQQVVEEVSKNQSVDQVKFTASLGGVKDIAQVIQNLKRITSYVRLGGLVILSFLLSSSLLILLVILGMRISTRRNEVEILQLMGATPGFIRMPFVFEGLFYALTGTLLGWLVAAMFILYIAPSLSTYFGEIPALPRDLGGLLALFGAMLGVEIVISFLLGTTGSLVALRRYLKI